MRVLAVFLLFVPEQAFVRAFPCKAHVFVLCCVCFFFSSQNRRSELRESRALPLPPASLPAEQVMISNLDYNLTEKDVEEFCSAAGAVAGVKLVKKWYAKTSKG